MTLDRTGEPVDVDDRILNHSTHDPRCQSGWLGEDLDGRLIPCLRCRPHLIRTPTIGTGVYR